jgi:hypothetical protein
MSTSCSSGCPTQDHKSWGECIRSKDFRVAYCQSASGHDASRQKRWDAELNEYRAAVAQGIEPDSTATRDTRRAVEWSNKTGVAYSEDTAHEVKVDKVLEKVA